MYVYVYMLVCIYIYIYIYIYIVRADVMALKMTLGRMECWYGRGRLRFTLLDTIHKYVSKDSTNIRLDAKLLLFINAIYLLKFKFKCNYIL